MIALGMDRREGKTSTLLEMLVEDDDVLFLTVNEAHADASRTLLREMIYQDKRFTDPVIDTAHEFKRRKDRIRGVTSRESLRGLRTTKVVIDEVDHVLYQLLGFYPDVVTYTQGER